LDTNALDTKNTPYFRWYKNSIKTSKIKGYIYPKRALIFSCPSMVIVWRLCQGQFFIPLTRNKVQKAFLDQPATTFSVLFFTLKIFQLGGIKLPPEKRLTERDLQLLEAVIKCGVISSKQAQEIYGVDNYHYKRISKLVDRGYLIRTGRHIQATPLGAKVFCDISGQEDNLTPVRIREPWQRKQKENVARIYFGLKNWHFMTSREIKKEKGISNSAFINCYVSNNGKGYAVYMLSSDPKKSTVRGIKSELDRLIEHGISKAIIFCPKPESMRKFGTYSGRSINELLLLPFPFGLNLLNSMESLNQIIQNKFHGFIPSNRPFADYEKGNTLVSVLIYNDLVKKEHLADYLSYTKKREGREIIIACLESQAAQFAAQFPGVKQHVIPDPKESDQNASNAS
jgi:hypothetical protein